MSNKSLGVIMLSMIVAVTLTAMGVMYYFIANRLELPVELSHFFFFIVCAVLGAVCSSLYMKYRKKRVGNTPIVDERIGAIVQKLINVMFAFLLIGGSIAIITLFFLGIETIEVGLLALIMGIFIIIFLISFVIIKKI